MGFMMPSVDDTAAADEAARQKRITEGKAKVNTAFAGFTPDWYAGRSKAYNEFALPQVEDQFKTSADQLKYALARQYGTTQTSEAATREAKLANAYQRAKMDITDKGTALANQARTGIEKERSSVLSQLNATADPAAAADMATTQAKLLQTPDVYDPVANYFGDVTEGLAMSAYPYGVAGAPTSGAPYKSGYGQLGSALSKAASYIT